MGVRPRETQGPVPRSEPAATDAQVEAFWAAAIERRAREVADDKVDLIEADEVHAEIARRLRARTSPTLVQLPESQGGDGSLGHPMIIWADV
jgi:hypothetical protein